MADDMEAVVDTIVSELNTFIATDSVDGGIADIVEVEAVYWGDPGVIPVNSYPAFLVQPVRDLPDIETTGYEVRDLEVLVTFLIDSRHYWDATPNEAMGDRMMVKVMSKVRNWFRTDSNRQLDGLAGTREVTASATDYLVQVRGSVIAKSAQVTLTVNKQRGREA
jgi:hypothetical protein